MTTDIQLASLIESELQKFDVTSDSLRALVEPVKDLKISGLDDREGYIRVRESRLILKNKRVEIEKNGKALRDNAIKFQKAVIAREKELISILEPAEARLKDEERRFEELKEQQRIENERRETERVQARINTLAAFNYAIDFYEAKIMSDDDFQKLCQQAEEDFKLEQERIAAEKAEQERLRKEEEERLKKEREELEQLRAEQTKREAELKAERERIAKEQQEREAAIRAEQDRIRQEQEAKEAELRAEREKLESERRRIELEEAKKQAAEKARLEEIARQEREEQERVERERQAKIEAERQEALRPLKEKYCLLADSLLKMDLPDPAGDANALALNLEVYDLLEKLYDHIKSRVKEL